MKTFQIQNHSIFSNSLLNYFIPIIYFQTILFLSIFSKTTIFFKILLLKILLKSFNFRKRMRSSLLDYLIIKPHFKTYYFSCNLYYLFNGFHLLFPFPLFFFSTNHFTPIPFDHEIKLYKLKINHNFSFFF